MYPLKALYRYIVYLDCIYPSLQLPQLYTFFFFNKPLSLISVAPVLRSVYWAMGSLQQHFKK